MQGAPEIAKLHFVELAAPPSKQARGGEGPKGGLAQAQALSKAYSSLTGVMLALKQQRRKQDQEAARSDHAPHHYRYTVVTIVVRLHVELSLSGDLTPHMPAPCMSIKCNTLSLLPDDVTLCL